MSEDQPGNPQYARMRNKDKKRNEPRPAKHRRKKVKKKEKSSKHAAAVAALEAMKIGTPSSSEQPAENSIPAPSRDNATDMTQSEISALKSKKLNNSAEKIGNPEKEKEPVAIAQPLGTPGNTTIIEIPTTPTPVVTTEHKPVPEVPEAASKLKKNRSSLRIITSRTTTGQNQNTLLDDILDDLKMHKVVLDETTDQVKVIIVKLKEAIEQLKIEEQTLCNRAVARKPQEGIILMPSELQELNRHKNLSKKSQHKKKALLEAHMKEQFDERQRWMKLVDEWEIQSELHPPLQARMKKLETIAGENKKRRRRLRHKILQMTKERDDRARHEDIKLLLIQWAYSILRFVLYWVAWFRDKFSMQTIEEKFRAITDITTSRTQLDDTLSVSRKSDSIVTAIYSDVTSKADSVSTARQRPLKSYTSSKS